MHSNKHLRSLPLCLFKVDGFQKWIIIISPQIVSFLSLLSIISIIEGTYVYVGLIALYYRHFYVTLSR